MIKQTDLEHLAKLARIKLTEEDKKSLIKEFDSILTYVDQLKKVEVSLDAEGRVGAVKNVMRGDVPTSLFATPFIIKSGGEKPELRGSWPHSEKEEEREALLNEAPHRVGDFIAVKKIIEQ